MYEVIKFKEIIRESFELIDALKNFGIVVQVVDQTSLQNLLTVIVRLITTIVHRSYRFLLNIAYLHTTIYVL